MKTKPITQMAAQGIVLSARDVGRANKVITILTKEYGLIEAFANGAKNSKSKLVSVAQPLSYASFILSKRGNQLTVFSADLIKIFYNVRENMDKLALSFYFAEITQFMAPKEESGQEFLRLILNVLHVLENDVKEYTLIKAMYELRLMSISGYMPDLICCAQCGVYDDVSMVFYPRSGYIKCMECSIKQEDNDPRIPVTTGTFLAMRHIIYSDLENFFGFEVKGESLKCLSYVCEAYVFEQTERTYTTLDFYKSIQTNNEIGNSLFRGEE